MSRLIWSGSSWSGRERHCAFVNLTDGKFADVSAILGLDFADDGRALAVVDWDGDGDLDLWFKNRTGPQLRFMRNDGAAGYWFSIKLVGARCNRDAVGARVVVHAAGRQFVQTVTAGSGYLAQSSKTLHFGLGQAEKIDRAEVRWPDGSSEALLDLRVDHHHTYTQSSGQIEHAAPRRLVLDAGDDPGKSDLPAAVRTVLREPMPLPADAVDGLVSGSGHSTLLTFWAHWCANCRAELTEFTEKNDQLTAAGVPAANVMRDPLFQCGGQPPRQPALRREQFIKQRSPRGAGEAPRRARRETAALVAFLASPRSLGR